MKLKLNSEIQLTGDDATYIISAHDDYEEIPQEVRDSLDAFFEIEDCYENYTTVYSDKGVYWNVTHVNIKGTNKYVVIPWEHDKVQGERMFPNYNNGLRRYTYKIEELI